MSDLRILKIKSDLFYNYTTVNITQSRIDKGLIAIPRSLLNWFPERNCKINVYLDDSSIMQIKNFSSYDSSTKEARIGSMREWFIEAKIKDGDEVVLQLVDKDKRIYRIMKESDFIKHINILRSDFDKSINEEIAESQLNLISNMTKASNEISVLTEYYRIVKTYEVSDRGNIMRSATMVREKIPPHLKFLIGKIYKGNCQVCGFGFIKRDGKPYFEIHHLTPSLGHFPQNLLLVCANCHKQFEYSRNKCYYSENGWLQKVKFNSQSFKITNIIERIKSIDSFKEQHII
jgi:hypothetical protein